MGMAVQDQIGTVVLQKRSKFSSVCQPFTPAHGAGCRWVVDQYDTKEFAAIRLIHDFFNSGGGAGWCRPIIGQHIIGPMGVGLNPFGGDIGIVVAGDDGYLIGPAD